MPRRASPCPPMPAAARCPRPGAVVREQRRLCSDVGAAARRPVHHHHAAFERTSGDGSWRSEAQTQQWRLRRICRGSLIAVIRNARVQIHGVGRTRHIRSADCRRGDQRRLCERHHRESQQRRFLLRAEFGPRPRHRHARAQYHQRGRNGIERRHGGRPRRHGRDRVAAQRGGGGQRNADAEAQRRRHGGLRSGRIVQSGGRQSRIRLHGRQRPEYGRPHDQQPEPPERSHDHGLCGQSGQSDAAARRQEPAPHHRQHPRRA